MVLDSAYDHPVGLDDEGVVCLYELLSYLLLDVDAAPPACDLGFGSIARYCSQAASESKRWRS
jgi:hypothetical protein